MGRKTPGGTRKGNAAINGEAVVGQVSECRKGKSTEDFDHFEPILAMGINRMPMLANAGIHTFFNGPESFTPDDRYYLGEAPELRGYWVAAGYNSIGIASSGGAGMALAQWMNDGEPPFDLWEVDIRRAQPFQKNRTYPTRCRAQ